MNIEKKKIGRWLGLLLFLFHLILCATCSVPSTNRTTKRQKTSRHDLRDRTMNEKCGVLQIPRERIPRVDAHAAFKDEISWVR